MVLILNLLDAYILLVNIPLELFKMYSYMHLSIFKILPLAI